MVISWHGNAFFFAGPLKCGSLMLSLLLVRTGFWTNNRPGSHFRRADALETSLQFINGLVFADQKWGLQDITRCVTHQNNDVIMGAIASKITSLTIVYSTVYSSADQRKHQSSAWLAFVRGIHRWPLNSPHKWPVTRKMFPSDDVIMTLSVPVPPPVRFKMDQLRWYHENDYRS